MAYTNNNSQTRVGVRIVPLSVVIPTPSALLDSYSGAAAAYSLRKLKSSYGGSAIRVRRSSDNTEQNIGFDSNGNLDTYELSAFVGTGNGFVTTWYDQSGNSRNVTQTTAINQPQIVSTGSLILENGKVSVNFDGVNHRMYSSTLTNWSSQGFSTYVVSRSGGLNSNGRAIFSISSNNNYTNGYLHLLYRNNITNNFRAFYSVDGGESQVQIQYPTSTFQTIQNLISVTRPASGNINFKLNNTTQSTITANTLVTLSGNFILGNYYTQNSDATTYSHQGTISEVIVYPNSQESNTNGINTNINTYYSVYPNPTSVWNLLKAVYSADTTASSSLKTSLVASYNGESNTNDSFGTNNGTAVGGLTYTTGKIGNAFNFNGTNAYVSLPNNSLNFTGDFSISFWAYYNSTSASYELFVSNYNNPSGANYGFNIYTDPSNLLIFDLYGGSLSAGLHTPFIPVANTWYMFTITRKRSTESKVYINGVYQPTAFYYPGSQGATFNQTYDSNQIVNLGSYLNGNLLSNIRMDAVNFWQKVLTQSEITELYNSGNGAQYIGDNFYKPTTNDALNTYNGTAQGGLTWGVGKVGTAFVGNGTNAYVSLPNNSFNFTGSMSINMWVNISSSTTRSTFMGNYYYVSGGRDYGWIIEHNSGNLGFYMQTGNNSPVIVSTSYSGKYNSWKMITVTKLQNSTLRLYIDGVLITTNYNTPDIYYNTTNYSTVCGYISSSVLTGPLENGGKVDAVGIWNRELSQAEVTELYNSGNGKQYPN